MLKAVVKLEVSDESKKIMASRISAPMPDEPAEWNRQRQRKMEIEVLEEIENMEERVCHASLQVSTLTCFCCQYVICK